MTNLSLPIAACRRSRLGISFTQGAHQVAQKLMSTALPLKSANLSGLSSASRNSRSGSALGGLASSNLATVPFSSSGPTSARAGKASAERPPARNSRRLGRKSRAGCAISRVPTEKVAFIHGTQEHNCASKNRSFRRQHDVGRALQAWPRRDHGAHQRLHRL